MDHEKIVVIGSNSFSGSSFVRYLLCKGHEVLGFSRSQEPEEVFLPYTWLKERLDRFHFEKADLNRDLEKIVEILTQEKPSCIVNFAALGMVAESWKKPEDWYQTNVLAQVKFHELLRKLKFIKKYVHVTTPEVYGNMDGWIAESFNFSPSTPYAVSRASCDLHLKSFFEAYNFPVVFTRAANVYGPGQQLYRIIPRTILYARLGKKLPLHGSGESERSFIYIDDVADATYRIIFGGTEGQTYHISTQETISIRDLVMKICRLIKVEFTDLVEESEERLGKDQSYKLSTNKIHRELGWQDTVNLEQGITSTIKWVDSNLDILKNMPHEYIHKA
jgi:dTDP-glucose 4,6-dehydratase|tara:strand:- start:7172 stop:8170 length:999 start_codon:yes stop_codon:yes gene_type:complete